MSKQIWWSQIQTCLNRLSKQPAAGAPWER